MSLTNTIPPRLQRTLLGHQTAWCQLTGRFDEGRFPSGWILSGPQGIGKATLAYQLARYILADKAEHTDNKDFYHGLIDQNAHPNLLVIERQLDEDGTLANEIKVDDIRRIKDFTQYSPALPGWRVIIIDALEDLNRNAANSLLKCLEEPPTQTVFLTITHCLGRILPTIRSRCQLMPLHALSENDSSSIGATPLETAVAGGSLGRLITFKNLKADQNLNTLFVLILKLIGEAFQGRHSEIIAFTSTLEKHDPRIPVILDLLTWVVARIVLLSSGCAACLPEDQSLSKLIMSISPDSDTPHWINVQQTLTLFLEHSRGAHLDQGHLLQACFILLKEPDYFQELTNR